MYSKIIKWISWVLIVVSAVVAVYGFIVGHETNDGTPVDVLLGWTYAMVGLGLGAVLLGAVVINAMNDPKSLLKLGIVLVCAAAVIAVAYVLAPGTPAIGYNGQPVTDMTLKLTDTILNLTYGVLALAIISIVAGPIVASIRNK